MCDDSPQGTTITSRRNHSNRTPDKRLDNHFVNSTTEISFSKIVLQLVKNLKKVQKQGRVEKMQRDYPTSAKIYTADVHVGQSRASGTGLADLAAAWPISFPATYINSEKRATEMVAACPIKVYS